jgi:hypothetical protein
MTRGVKRCPTALTFKPRPKSLISATFVLGHVGKKGKRKLSLFLSQVNEFKYFYFIFFYVENLKKKKKNIVIKKMTGIENVSSGRKVMVLIPQRRLL